MTVTNCAFCDVEFEYQRVTKRKRFCSIACGSRARTGYRVLESRCAWCLNVYVIGAGSGGKNRRFCSKRCCDSESAWQIKFDNRQLRRNAVCLWCLNNFEASKVGQKCCTNVCLTKLRNHLNLHGSEDSCRVRWCACGQMITHDPGVSRVRPPRANACFDCRQEMRREYQNQRGRRKSAARRLAVTNGERFTKLKLVQIHGRICYLCDEPVLFDRSLPRKQWASIDHVRPISRGGSHTIENCRVVHFGCNSRKAAKLIGLEI
jgi:hypothetical protein